MTDLSVTVNSPGTANFTYSNSTGVFTYTPPDLSGYSTFSGSYNDLTNKPVLFSGSYDDLTNKPVLFSGDYNDLTNKPTVPSGIDDLNDVTVTPVSSGSPADGDVLTWSTSSGQWVNQQPSGGGGGTTTAPADDSPVGVISMWAGSTSSIPDGWQLCDGGSAATSELQSIVGSTVPDLRDKFIVGAGNTYSVGNTGGSPNAVVVEHSHTGETHAHGINTSFNINASGTTSTDDVPHTHPIAGTVGTGSGLNAGADYTGNYSPRSTNAATDTNHSHTFSINTTASLSGSTDNSGGGNTGVEGVNAEGKNLPPYYSLCYIIKNDASLYLKSPNGTSFRLSVDNSGNVSATSV